jgi:PDDEXK-like domain of unknown function (DUF3799)
MKIDQPGVYDLSVKEYFADPVAGGSLTSSGARLLLPPNCPAMFHYQRSHPRPNSATFDDGHAAHAVALGVGAPMRIIDADDFKTKAARAEREDAYTAGEIPVLAKTWTRIEGMAAALRDHDEAGPLFTPGAGLAERTIVWWDEEFGIWRRAMVDWLPGAEPDERQIVVDYKTSVSAEPGAISKHIHNYGYHRQAAWYVDGVAAVVAPNDIEPAFVFVFQEKEPPYLITVVQIDSDALEWGRIQNRKAMSVYAKCVANDHWPSYTDKIISVGLPSYAKYQYEAAYDRGDYSIGDEDE